MYFQSIKEGFLKPFPKQNTHKQSYLSQATNAHDLTQPQPASRQMPSWSCCQRSKLRESGAYVKELLKETVSPLKFQRPGPLKDPSGNLHASGALASTAWSCKYAIMAAIGPLTRVHLLGAVLSFHKRRYLSETSLKRGVCARYASATKLWCAAGSPG